MNQDKFKILRKDFEKIGMILLGVIIVFKILFHKESLFVILKLVLSFTWLIILPGFSLMYYWKLKFVERFLIGIGLGTVCFGGLSYWLGLIGVHIKYHIVVLPIVLVLIGWFVCIKKL